MYWFAFLNRLLREWTVVSTEEAQRNPYFGFRGRLLIPYLLTIVGLIQNLSAVFATPDPTSVEFPQVRQQINFIFSPRPRLDLQLVRSALGQTQTHQ